MNTKTLAEAQGRRVNHSQTSKVASSLHPSWLDEEYLEAATMAFRENRSNLSYESYLAQKASKGSQEAAGS